MLTLRRDNSIGPTDARLIVHASRVGTVSNRSAREWLGVDRDAALQALQRLRDAGVLIQSGEREGVRYGLAPGLGLPSASNLDDASRKRLIAELAETAPVSNARVRERLDVDAPKATALLNELVSEGVLRRTGARRGTRYEPV